MEKIFATKAPVSETTYHYNGVPIDRNLVLQLANEYSWKYCTPEAIREAGVEIRTFKQDHLFPLRPRDYTGPGLPEFEREEDGVVHFLKRWGDRPGGFELRARVAEQIGQITILTAWERRDFYYGRDEEGKTKWGEVVYRDWQSIDFDGYSFTHLVW